MSIIIRGGSSSNLANVDNNGNLNVNNPTAMTQAGHVSMVSMIDEGSFTGSKTFRPIDVSYDGRLKIGGDSLWWDDTFNHATFNTSTYLGVTSTMTVTLASGFLNMNAGNATATGNVARVQTYRTFPVLGTYPLVFDCWMKFSAAYQTNVVQEFGFGYATTTTAPTDGIFFRVESGILKGVLNNNGSEVDTGVNTLLVATAGTVCHFSIVINNDIVEFWVNEVLRGTVTVPTTVGGPSLAGTLPLLIRQYNNGVAGGAIQMNFSRLTISQGDLVNNRLWATSMVGAGNSSISAPQGQAAAQTANYANSAAPASATLSNTAAGYTTLGGQWQFAAVAGAETDYALFGYQVPAGTAAIPGKNMMVRGIRIEAVNTGAAVATTATLLQWGIAVGSTAVSLATTDSATAGTRAPRRATIGIQTFAVGAAIGATASPIDVNFDVPLLVEAGTFFHVILKMPVGTATVSQVVRGTCFVNAYFE